MADYRVTVSPTTYAAGIVTLSRTASLAAGVQCRRMTESLPGPPPRSTRVDPWEDIDGRRARFFECQVDSRTSLQARVAGFQLSDGRYDDVKVIVAGGEIALHDLDAAIEDLSAAGQHARSLSGG